MTVSAEIWAIIPAGGRGIRASLSTPKQFARLNSVTVLERTLRIITGSPRISAAVVALPEEYVSQWEKLLTRSEVSNGKLVLVVPGGTTRQDSVLNCLNLVPKSAGYVLIHDAARPFVTPDLLERVIVAAFRYGAAICATRPRDTIKMVSSPSQEVVLHTPSRSSLVEAQTPQVFRTDIIRQAYGMAYAAGFVGTDDSQLVERVGFQVFVVEGDPGNFKITYPEDLEYARYLTSKEQGNLEMQNIRSKRPVLFRRGSKFARTGTILTGIGFDVHPLVHGRRLVLGGVDIPFERGLAGHSDADVLIHAVMDAILGAAGRGDIGEWFPPSDERYKDANSLLLLTFICSALEKEFGFVNIDCTLLAEKPKINSYKDAMRSNIAGILGLSPDRVSIKATTMERLGSIGREEGIAALCVATLVRKRR